MGENAQLMKIALSEIRESKVALRDVDRTSEAYIGLVDSIKAQGVLNAILVRESTDEEGAKVYALIDGLHRFYAAKDAGLTEIPAQVVSLEDAEVLEAQIMANIHKVETKPVQYSKQLMRILSGNPSMVVAELATKLAKSSAWVSERLGLLRLDEAIAKLVDENKINLSNAYVLARLPKEEQADYIDRAMTDNPQVFIPTVNTRLKEIRDAKRAGKDAAPAEFTPVAHLQKLSSIKEEKDAPKVRDVVLRDLGAKNAADGWNAALSWILHLDPKSIEAAKVKDEQRKKDLAEAKSRRKVERDEKKAKEASEKAAALQDEAKKSREALA